MTTKTADRFVQAAQLSDLRGKGSVSVQVDGHPIVLFLYGEDVYAVDNRCPHMGFPLDRGSVRDGILTCHWHHARFDLASGGTFDLFADDVPVYPTVIEDGAVWVDLTPQGDHYGRMKSRLENGLEHDISLVMAKAIIGMLDYPDGAQDVFRVTLDFGGRYA